ncbi:glycosyltransferase family 2 protein [Sandarakinorhabdus sp.]|uniref:glycosyltransferase n=1 Tax=Sandarakinorhabdus sp. TaxID=1916663 RepID=UPI00286D6D12|nr:glycosyltransferase family 2 protein [Sandarakinorhabdus sp.]
MTDQSPGADGAAQGPRVSVIIPHYNMPQALERCLASVKAQAGAEHAEIIVVDNGSRISLDDVKARHSDVRFLSESQPGPGLARNTGVAAARAPILAFIDADCRAEAGWLEAAVSAIEATGPDAIVGGDVRIDFVDTRRLTDIEAYEAVFAYRQAMYINKQGFSGTGNLAMAAPVHAAVGPFAGIDTAEDRDWGQRAAAAGYRTVYVEAMRVYHPARPDFASLVVKWQRHIRHDWTAHVAAGRPRWRWQMRAALMLPSILVDGVRLMLSDRLSGLGNRWRGVTVLARLRWLRAGEMLRAMHATGETGATFWNPGA